MRAARLIKLVLLLQSRPSVTAPELARQLEVSERTVARDVLALSEAGVPVYADRGRAGGYRLVGGYRTRLTGMGRREAEALFLSGVPSALRELGLADAGSAARLKVAAALLPELSDAPANAAQRFHLDAPGWWQEPGTPELLPDIATAVWDDRTLSARYRRAGGEVARELEPYGLVLKAGVWYLAARPAGASAVGGAAAGGATAGEGASTDGDPDGDQKPRPAHRVYRVDRFTDVTPGPERFVRDESFDLEAFWADRAEAFARSILRDTVVLRLSETGAGRLPYATDRAAGREAVESASDPGADGWVTVTLPVESLDVAFGQLLMLGPEAEVLEPVELRRRFADAAVRSAALYGETPEGGDGRR
ncbi:helix-turn-helix transcriptional regulator [Streptomyces sp. NPDC048639]|uniref:helix-turn-helix transcriptional regulator n=1 Tax=Streptomyces sp. NPDC048639 TaxID=3365581 RepID=UPI003714B621